MGGVRRRAGREGQGRGRRRRRVGLGVGKGLVMGSAGCFPHVVRTLWFWEGVDWVWKYSGVPWTATERSCRAAMRTLCCWLRSVASAAALCLVSNVVKVCCSRTPKAHHQERERRAGASECTMKMLIPLRDLQYIRRVAEIGCQNSARGFPQKARHGMRAAQSANARYNNQTFRTM
ncbi:uncharacterized protein EV422DRAFT_523568 [Fimicolochytrium jonesii]|uniref:uncharacterized protein n=1 Tax=Fimicolochytrium jonesii TaxID=1396493 RepID=UPI0022FE6832|nr:uncharacterized protein EV422DRAFT_523568 [Fimicolochytrium jonesii]KAI8823156.1 hypothetical protein EV422DRAFT_523568 [Fimicolochytrium jonesii]